MTKLAHEWVRTSDPVIRSPARYHWTTAPASTTYREHSISWSRHPTMLFFFKLNKVTERMLPCGTPSSWLYMSDKVLHQSVRTLQAGAGIKKAPFICSHCDNVFSRAYSLRRHQDTCKARN